MARGKRILFGGVVLFTILLITQLSFPITSQPIPKQTRTYPDGYDPNGGYLDKVTFIVYPPEDKQLGLQALQANLIYAWDERVPAENIVELQTTAGVEVSTEPGDMSRFILFNCNRFPTNITEYRRAFAQALDKHAIIQASTGGLAFLQDCVFPIALGNWTYENELPETYYTRDITSANATFESAGFRDLNGDGWRDYDTNNNSLWDSGVDLDSQEFKIELRHVAGHTPSQHVMEIALDALNQCGIRAEIVLWDFHDELWGDSLFTNFWVVSATFTRMHSIDLLFRLFHSSTGNNQYYLKGWNNSTYDAAAEALMNATTEPEANDWAWECQKILWHELPCLPLYNDIYTHAYRTDIWEGYINRACRNRIGNGYSLVHIKLKGDAGGPFGCYPTEYVMSLNEGLDTTNWLMSNSEYTKKVFQLVYDELTTISPYDWTYQPSLAYAWETEATNASGDIQEGEKYTFHLFENTTWNDGTPVTATDVAFSVTLGLLDPYNAENYENIYMTNVLDSKTIEIFTNKTGYIEWTRATGFTVYPAHIWPSPNNAMTWEPTVEELVGSGPYVFRAHVPGQYIVLERHHAWHFAVEMPLRSPCPCCIDYTPYILLLGVIVIIIQVLILGYYLNKRRNTKFTHQNHWEKR